MLIGINDLVRDDALYSHGSCGYEHSFHISRGKWENEDHSVPVVGHGLESYRHFNPVKIISSHPQNGKMVFIEHFASVHEGLVYPYYVRYIGAESNINPELLLLRNVYSVITKTTYADVYARDVYSPLGFWLNNFVPVNNWDQVGYNAVKRQLGDKIAHDSAMEPFCDWSIVPYLNKIFGTERCADVVLGNIYPYVGVEGIKDHITAAAVKGPVKPRSLIRCSPIIDTTRPPDLTSSLTENLVYVNDAKFHVNFVELMSIPCTDYSVKYILHKKTIPNNNEIGDVVYLYDRYHRNIHVETILCKLGKIVFQCYQRIVAERGDNNPNVPQVSAKITKTFGEECVIEIYGYGSVYFDLALLTLTSSNYAVA